MAAVAGRSAKTGDVDEGYSFAPSASVRARFDREEDNADEYVSGTSKEGFGQRQEAIRETQGGNVERNAVNDWQKGEEQ